MKNTTTNNTQKLSQKEKRAAYDKARYEANREEYLAQMEEWRKANPEKIKSSSKKYYQANKEKISSSVDSYRKNNKDKYSIYYKTYYSRNREKIKSKNKLYREANREEIQKKVSKKIKADPLLLAKQKLRCCVQSAFRRIIQNKPANTQALLGCSWEEARAHFESLFQKGMSWENHGEWHIDHIRPVASFREDELHLMNLISNLQPLWALDNIAKSNKL